MLCRRKMQTLLKVGLTLGVLTSVWLIVPEKQGGGGFVTDATLEAVGKYVDLSLLGFIARNDGKNVRDLPNNEQQSQKAKEAARLAERQRKEEAKIANQKNRMEEEAENKRKEEARIAEQKRKEKVILAELKKKEEEVRVAAQQKEEALIAEQKRKEEEALLAEQKRKEEELKLAAQKKQEEEAMLAEQKRKEEELRLAAQKKQEAETLLAEQKRKEEELKLAAQKKQEEEAMLAEQKRKEEELRLAAQKKQEAETLLAEQKRKEEELRLAAQKKQEEEAALLAKQKKKEEELRLAAQKKQEEEAALLAKQKKQEEELRLAAQMKKEEELRLAARKKQEEEALLAEQKRKEESKLAQQKREKEAKVNAEKAAQKRREEQEKVQEDWRKEQQERLKKVKSVNEQKRADDARRADEINEAQADIEDFSKEQAVGSVNEEQPPEVHLAVVACGDRMPETIVLLKSARMLSRVHLTFHVFAEEELKPKFKEEFRAWPADVKKQTKFDIRSLSFPSENEADWKKLFKTCASQRLFLPDLLPKLDAVLYLDTDILFMRPPEDIWRFFRHFNSSQIAAVAPEHEDANVGWYNRFARHPFYPPLGVNSGVMLMNLTRMRKVKWVSAMIPYYKEYKYRITWGDQDLINIYFHFRPEMLYIYPCHWNYRPDHCMYMSICHPANIHGANIVHGNRRVWFNDKQPAFKVLYNAFRDHELKDNLSKLLTQLETNMGAANIQQTNCGRNSASMIKQLERQNQLIIDAEKARKLKPSGTR